jgi:S1-C subfamily serine protease
VQGGGPAYAAGLKAGDVLVSLDDQAISSVDDIARVLDATRIGRAVAARIVRDGALQSVEIVPTERV